MGLEKINEYKKVNGLTNKKISEMTGISISSLDKITSGENKNPKLETIKLICSALGCSLNDLVENSSAHTFFYEQEKNIIQKYRNLDGHGKKMVNMVLTEEYARCTSEQEETEEEPKIKIKRSIYKVSAGHGFDLTDEDEWEEIEIPDTPEARKADFALIIKGNSMEPIYSDGETVLVKEQPAVDIGETGIYIINGSGFIKKNGGDRLISINPYYDDILFSDGDMISCAGKVIGCV